MTKAQRKEIDTIREAIEEQKYKLADIAEAEREKFDNLPEGLQAAERGQAIEEGADTLDDLVSSLDDVIDSLSELTEG